MMRMTKSQMCHEIIAKRPEYGKSKKIWTLTNWELERILARIRQEDMG